MSTGTIIPLAFFAVAVIVILAVLGWLLIKKQTQRRHRVKAEAIRDQAKDELLQVNRRQALAEETAAKARAAQAEADVRAAQAADLEQQAAGHRRDAKASRDRLDEQWDRAEALHPATPAPDKANSADVK